MQTQSFLGHLPDNVEPVHIVGGGFAGLCCAYYCKKNNTPFHLYEKEKHVGGMLRTTFTPYGPAESAANGFIWCREIAAMAEHLKLTLLPPSKSSNARYIVRNGELRRMPLSFIDILRTMKRMFLARPAQCATLQDFGTHYFGKVATEKMMAPGIAGIYGTELDKLSFSGTLPGLYEVSQQPGSFLLNMFRFLRKRKRENPQAFKGTWSFEGGMQTLTDAIRDYLGDAIQYKEIHSLRDLPTGEQVILCAPASASANILKDHTAISELLSEMQYLPLIAATLFFEADSFSKMKSGFGCLVPSSEPCVSRGILFNHDIFSGRIKDPATYSLSFVLYPDRLDGGVHASDDVVVAACKKDAAYLLGLEKEPLNFAIARWSAALPVYSPRHMQVLEALDGLLKEELPYVCLLGNYTGEIALRGMLQSAATVLDN